jgi:hypothetical protein
MPYITDIVQGQFHRDDSLRIGVDGEMQFAPASARPGPVLLVKPFAFAVDLHTFTVDKQMQRLVRPNALQQNLQLVATPTERGVVGDPDLDAEQIRDRSQRTLGLTQRLTQHQAKGQSRLNGDV